MEIFEPGAWEKNEVGNTRKGLLRLAALSATISLLGAGIVTAIKSVTEETPNNGKPDILDVRSTDDSDTDVNDYEPDVNNI